MAYDFAVDFDDSVVSTASVLLRMDDFCALIDFARGCVSGSFSFRLVSVAENERCAFTRSLRVDAVAGRNDLVSADKES